MGKSGKALDWVAVKRMAMTDITKALLLDDTKKKRKRKKHKKGGDV